LLDGRCPVGRNELTSDDWLLLGMLEKERELIISEELRKQQSERHPPR